MARLNWVRMDSNWWGNPKFLQLRYDKRFHAICVYWASVGWTADHGQHGFIPGYAMPEIDAQQRDIDALVEVCLWEPTEGGWQVHDYLEHQPGAVDAEKRTERAKKAAKARWAKENAAKAVGDLRIV